MPAWVQAVVLGIVQGLTEFIPVSSSGHLVIIPYLAGWQDPGLAFDVALHVGTAAAVVLFFRRELYAMLRGLLGARDANGRVYRQLALLVVVGSVPVAGAGLALEDQVSSAFEQPLAVAGFLVLTALLLVAAERARTRRVARHMPKPLVAAEAVWSGSWIGVATADAVTGDDEPTLPIGDDPTDPAAVTLEVMHIRHAIVIGVLQVLALLPGVSRSGATISAGMFTGLSREAATRFSFLLSLPALVGAFVVSLPDLATPGPYSAPIIAGGVAASFVSGYAAIRFLVALVARDRLTGFARYCVFVAAVTAVGYLFLGPPSAA